MLQADFVLAAEDNRPTLAYINLERTATSAPPALPRPVGLRRSQSRTAGRHLHCPRGRTPGPHQPRAARRRVERRRATTGRVPGCWPTVAHGLHSRRCAAASTTTCPHNRTPEAAVLYNGHIGRPARGASPGLFRHWRAPGLPGPLIPVFHLRRISMTHRDVFIVSTARTAIGTFGGAP